MGPQAVPRGFLRMYVISLFSRNPESGYSLMRHIEEKTKGTWRPGPGTIYPLLKSLSEEGLIQPTGREGREDSVTYSATEKGKQELAEMQRMMLERGKEGQALIGLMGEMFPASQYASFFTKHFREMHQLFAEMAMEIPEAQRDVALREVEAVLEEQLKWIRRQLSRKVR
jgi:DNA-binding PadR family transcriptional regulator